MKSPHKQTRTLPLAGYLQVWVVGSLLTSCACSTQGVATKTHGGASAGGGAQGAADAAVQGAGAGGERSLQAVEGREAETPSVEDMGWVELLDGGVWLVGWAGAVAHYSWLRFTPGPPGASDGTFEIRDSECGRCMTGYLDCAGAKGSYSLSGGELLMTYPPSCALDQRRWSFGERGVPLGGLGRDALAVWPVTLDDGDVIDAYFYDSSQCDPEFLSCEPL